MDNIKIKNSNNRDIAAVIHYPIIECNKLAILCPGYLDTKDYAHLIGLAESLANLGFTVVRFDPTGTWESTGDISEYTTTQYLKDVKSVIDYMLSQKPYNYILLGGHSRGGRVSILYASTDHRISAVLAIMASSRSIRGSRREEWNKTGFSTSYRDIPGKIEKKEFKVPESHVINLDTYNTIEALKNIHIPIIFVAGETDTTVPAEDVKELYENANDPKKFILLAGIGHDYRHRSKEVEEVDKILIENISEFFAIL